MYHKKDQISGQIKILNEVHLLAMEEYKLHQEFLLYEAINPIFFKTGFSPKVQEHSTISKKIEFRLILFKRNEHAKLLFEGNFVNKIIEQQNNYQNIFSLIVQTIKNKGFKDFGVEGEMRDYAHTLMDIKELNQVDILMLRRNEKDFIIRKDILYVEQFDKIISKLRQDILNEESKSVLQKLRLDSIINGYSAAFKKLVKIDRKLIGKKSSPGLLLQLTGRHDIIVSQINVLKINASSVEANLFKSLLLGVGITMFIIFAIAFIFSFKIATHLSKPIVNLNKYMHDYVASKFSKIPLLETRKSKDEIAELSNSFFKMVEEITNHIKFFEDKVAERTTEVNKQNKEIVRQQEKINLQYKQEKANNNILEIQRKLLFDKHKNITDSINYAERIQKAIMPAKIAVKNILSNGFIYFQPRDIVSGDFYYLHEKKNKIFFAVADCTGHGVPGAFISIVGIHAIQRALNEFELEQPAEILNKVNDLLEQSISNYDETIINDGMDIAFCCYEKVSNTLEFSGANMPLWIVSKKISDEYESDEEEDIIVRSKEISFTYQVKEIQADKQPIGYYQKRLPFSNRIIDVEAGSMIYIFTDGYADQFGGAIGKKFKYNKLRNLLIEIQELPLDKQKQSIKETLVNWKGNYEQVDDICVLGFKID